MSDLRKQLLKTRLLQQHNINDLLLFHENGRLKKENDILVRQINRIRGFYKLHKYENSRLKHEVYDLNVRISNLEDDNQG